MDLVQLAWPLQVAEEGETAKVNRAEGCACLLACSLGSDNLAALVVLDSRAASRIFIATPRVNKKWLGILIITHGRLITPVQIFFY